MPLKEDYVLQREMGVIANGSLYETQEDEGTLEFKRTRIQECKKVYLVNMGCSVNAAPPSANTPSKALRREKYSPIHNQQYTLQSQ